MICEVCDEREAREYGRAGGKKPYKVNLCLICLLDILERYNEED